MTPPEKPIGRIHIRKSGYYYVGVSTAARAAGVAHNTVSYWIKRGLISPVPSEDGKTLLIPEDQLLAQVRRLHPEE